jgi:hypothetical protein
MSVALVVTINATSFDKRSSEVAYLARVLEIAAAELSCGQGAVTSGSIIGTGQSGSGPLLALVLGRTTVLRLIHERARLARSNIIWLSCLKLFTGSGSRLRLGGCGSLGLLHGRRNSCGLCVRT